MPPADRVGHVEQAAHECPVALDDLLEQRRAIAAGRWPLDDEASLGADGDDDGVLDRLRLHQPEHLGAEVLAPVRPADAAAGDPAAAQVHGLDARRVDEDLEHRPRLGQVGNEVGIELERQVRLRLAGGVRLEVVRAQHGADDAQEAAQDPVLVEALDGVDLALQPPLERTRLHVRIVGLPRIQPDPEELDDAAGHVGVVGRARPPCTPG